MTEKGEIEMSNRFMEKLQIIVSLIRRFFWWSAGVVPSVLEKCPTNQAKYTSIGVITFLISFLAIFSGAFFFSSTFDIPFVLALPGGILFGILIFSIDRVVLTSFRKEDTSKISIIQRYILTISIAFLIGEPLLLHIFRKEIAFEMAQKSQVVSADSRQKAFGRFQTEINTLETENKKIEERLDTLNQDRDTKENAVIGEIEGTIGSGKKGEGPAAARKNTAFTEADAKYKEYKTDSSDIIKQNKERMATMRGEIETETRTIAAANAQADGFLAKHAALFNIITTQPGAAFVYIPLFFFLLFFETLPLSLKVFGKKSVYDQTLEQEETGAIENLKAETDRRRLIKDAIAERISDSIIKGESASLPNRDEQSIADKIRIVILQEIAEKEFKRQTAENYGVKFGQEITVEVVGFEDLSINVQLPENAADEISLKDLAGDIEKIADKTGAEDLKLKSAFSSKGHEIWEDLPLLPQLEYDRKLVLQFEPITVT